MVWFVLSLGVAVASPVVKPGSIELVCSTGGALKLLPSTDDGQPQRQSALMLDCPLCNATGGPPPMADFVPVVPSALAHVLRPAVAAHIAWLTAAPLPPRGPPASVIS